MINQLPPLREIVKEYSLMPEKKLGQNFLFDMNITDKIVRAAGDLTNSNVIEIGPGPGGLTRSILKAEPKHLTAIEKDPRCIAALNSYLVPASDKKLTVIDGDALNKDLYNNICGKVKIIANLPYNVATELLFMWLTMADKIESMTLMFQKEVAMRINAVPRTKDYGRVSIKTQWLCEVEHIFDIPPTAFFPPPKVTSTVIKLTPHPKMLYEAVEEKLDTVCRAAFSQRRKTLRASLKQISDNPVELLARAGIDDNRRPEELSIEEFCRLARTL